MKWTIILAPKNSAEIWGTTKISFEKKLFNFENMFKFLLSELQKNTLICWKIGLAFIDNRSVIDVNRICDFWKLDFILNFVFAS